MEPDKAFTETGCEFPAGESIRFVLPMEQGIPKCTDPVPGGPCRPHQEDSLHGLGSLLQ